MSLQRLNKSATHFRLFQLQSLRRIPLNSRLCTANPIKFVRCYTSTIPDTKDANSILKVLDQIKQDSNTPSHYNNLLKQLAVNGRSIQAQKVYDEIFREHEIEADINTYSQLMLAYVNDGKYEEAMEIYYELRDHEDSPNNSVKNLRLDVETYADMIDSLTDSKNMVLNGTQFDPTVEPLYEYSVEDVDSAIYQDIEGDSQPSLLTALTLFNDMRHLEIQPTSSMYTRMLKACIEQKDRYVLEKLHKLIRMDLYLDPDLDVFNSLMEAYSVVGDGTSVLEIWDVLETSENYDKKSISIVLKTCSDHGFKTRSKSISEALKSKNIELPVNNEKED